MSTLLYFYFLFETIGVVEALLLFTFLYFFICFLKYLIDSILQ